MLNPSRCIRCSLVVRQLLFALPDSSWVVFAISNAVGDVSGASLVHNSRPLRLVFNNLMLLAWRFARVCGVSVTSTEIVWRLRGCAVVRRYLALARVCVLSRAHLCMCCSLPGSFFNQFRVTSSNAIADSVAPRRSLVACPTVSALWLSIGYTQLIA
jgi:hypothetical protein